jgi:hypothetical protein
VYKPMLAVVTGYALFGIVDNSSAGAVVLDVGS